MFFSMNQSLNTARAHTVFLWMFTSCLSAIAPQTSLLAPRSSLLHAQISAMERSLRWHPNNIRFELGVRKWQISNLAWTLLLLFPLVFTSCLSSFVDLSDIQHLVTALLLLFSFSFHFFSFLGTVKVGLPIINPSFVLSTNIDVNV